MLAHVSHIEWKWNSMQMANCSKIPQKVAVYFGFISLFLLFSLYYSFSICFSFFFIFSFIFVFSFFFLFISAFFLSFCPYFLYLRSFCTQTNKWKASKLKLDYSLLCSAMEMAKAWCVTPITIATATTTVKNYNLMDFNAVFFDMRQRTLPAKTATNTSLATPPPNSNSTATVKGEAFQSTKRNFIMLNVFNFGLLSIFISRKSGRQRLF